MKTALRRVVAKLLPVVVGIATLATCTCIRADDWEDLLALEKKFNAHYQAGRYREAEPLAKRMVQIAELSFADKPSVIATSLENLAIVHSLIGEYAKAEPLYQRSLKIKEAKLGENHPGVADSLNNLAILYMNMGQYGKAEPLYQRSLKIKQAKLGENHPGVGDSLNNLANLYSDMGQYGKAEPLYQRSLKIREANWGEDHPDVASSLNNLANLYRYTGQYGNAEPLYLRSLKIKEAKLGKNHPNVAMSLYNLGFLYWIQGRDADGLPLLDRSIDILTRAASGPADLYNPYKIRAEVFWKQARRAEALSDLHHAMALAELQRRHGFGGEQEHASLFAKFAGAFELMVSWQMELGDCTEALAAMERSRARSLVDQMQAQGTDLLAALSEDEAKALRRREGKAKETLASLEKQLQVQDKSLSEEEHKSRQAELLKKLPQARQEVVDAYAAIRNASPAYRLAVGKDLKPVGLSDLQAWLNRHEGMLLEYLLGTEGSYVLLIPAQGPARLEKLSVKPAQANELGIPAGALTAQRLKECLSTKDEKGVLQELASPDRCREALPKLAALWEVLVPDKERQELMAGKTKRLLVVPDGPLALLPFEALVSKMGEKPQYLLDTGVPISYGPSATILVNLSQREGATLPPDRSPVLSVADPAYPDSDSQQVASNDHSALEPLTARSRYGSLGGRLARLPHSGDESDWVATNYRDTGVKVKQLRGDKATKINVRGNVKDRRVVHLACHGLMDQAYGNLFGALALAPGEDEEGNRDDGFLTLSQIYELDLRGCELAILSACETNLGPEQRGEGVWALSRGFLVAGARRVVASDWLVDDEAAASLVSVFTEGIAKAEKKDGKADYARQLLEARRWVRKQDKWQSPYYWAGMVLVGPE